MNMRSKHQILKKYCHVKRVLHISDIHIKNESVHRENYLKVFNTLFTEMTKIKICNNDVIVITGDIMDDGKSITPDAIELAKFFYYKLSEYTDVITILGNHEYKPDTGKDTLTPIVNKYFSSQNALYFLLDNEVYLYGDIAFVHTKFDSKEITQCIGFDKYVKIALFHGIIHGCSLENGFLGRSQFNMSDFKNFDYCMFGDVHINKYLNKKETAWYAGSLLAQSISEDPLRHGAMLLNLDKKKSEFILIENKSKKLDLLMDNNGDLKMKCGGKMINFDNNILKNTTDVDMKITFESSNKKLLEQMKQKFGDSGTKINKCTVSYKQNNVPFDVVVSMKDGNKKKLSDVSNTNDLIVFLSYYINNVHKDIEMNKIRKTLEELVDKDKQMISNREIKFLKIELNNIMRYGENVILDLSKMNGVVGLCETNSMGKSTICESPSIILHGKTPRCEVPVSFIKKGKIECYGIIWLLVDKVEYMIKRIIRRRGVSKRAKVKNENSNKKKDGEVFLEIIKYTNKEKGEYEAYTNCRESLNGKILFKKMDDIASIQKMIDVDIISFDDMYKNFIVSQGRCNSFVNVKNKRDELFNKTTLSYLNNIGDNSINKLTLLKKNRTVMFKEISEDFGDSKCYDTDSIQKQINNIAEENDKLTGKINGDYVEKENEYNKNLQEVVRCEERLKNYNEFSDIDDTDVDKMEEISEKLKNNIKSTEINKMIDELKKYEKEFSGINIKIKKFGDIDDKKKKFDQNKRKKVTELHEQVNKLTKGLIKCDNVDKKQYDLAKKENAKIGKKIIGIGKDIEYVQYKIKLGNSKEVFSNYKMYFDEFSEFCFCEEKMECINDIYDELLEKVTDKKVIDVVKNVLDEKKCDIEIRIKKIQKSLDGLVKYRDDYEMYDPTEDLHEELESLDDEKNDLVGKMNKNMVVMNDYENELINNNVNRQIDELKEKIEEAENDEIEKYDEYCDLVKQSNELDKKINGLKINIEKEKVKINKYVAELEKNEGMLKQIQIDKEKYDVYCETKKKHMKLLNEQKKIKDQFNKIKQEKQKCDANIKKVNESVILAKSALAKCRKVNEQINILEIIKNTLCVNGLIDKMMKETILPALRKVVDEMCEYSGHEKINIDMSLPSLESKNNKYEIVISTDKCPDISNVGGFQSNIIDLIFALAFLQMGSNRFKSDLIIIDELFDAASNENKHVAISLLEYFKTVYDKLLVVSHNDDIIQTFDKRLRIKNEGGNVVVVV